MKQIVFPGEHVGIERRTPNVYIEKGKAYSSVVGLYDERSRTVIPLEGAYAPHTNDNIVGIIKSEKNGIYELDIQHFDRCLLITDKRDELINEGSIVSATVTKIENKKTIIVEMPRILKDGMLIYVKPTKVPRIIGKNNTMIGTISKYTGTNIVIGMNGLIWLKGGNTALAIEAILKVENEAHIEGLTNRIKDMLEKETSFKNTG
ncbi:MAG: KH domain-containing protein [Candidatus Micrarchaeia archaeon]